MTAVTELRGVAWDHPRAIAPLRATADAFATLRPDVHITWEARSLERFAYARLEELATLYDLLVIDHPHIGDTGMRDLIEPLDQHLPADFLVDQASNSVGQSHSSYQWMGHQWALAIDAAAQVAAFREDLLYAAGVQVPTTWDGVLSLATQLPDDVRMALPLTEIDAACCLISIGVDLIGPSFWRPGAGYDPAALGDAVGLLTRLARIVDPRSFDSNPIRLLEIMGHDDAVAYAPLVFGYSNYARPGFVPHDITFADAPGHAGVARGSVLGGAGLAVSSRSSFVPDAVAYAAFVAQPDTQRHAYFASGGQPGHRAAWVDPEVNLASRDFFRGTLRTLDASFLRPRLAEEPRFHAHQASVGRVLQRMLQGSSTAREIAAAVTAQSSVLAP